MNRWKPQTRFFLTIAIDVLLTDNISWGLFQTYEKILRNFPSEGFPASLVIFKDIIKMLFFFFKIQFCF